MDGVSEQPDPNLEFAAARLGVEWATKVRETFRQLGTSIPPVWPGTRAGARSLVDRLCHSSADRNSAVSHDVERLTSIIELRASQAWRRIRCWSGEETADTSEGLENGCDRPRSG
jgi:hypothetical protein